MPLYEYECQGCGQRTETLQRMAEAPLTVCPECGGPLKKLVSRAGFAFKGSGWYVTDYAGKKSGGSAGGKAEPAAGGAEAAKTETASKETKSKDGETSPSASTKTAAST